MKKRKQNTNNMFFVISLIMIAVLFVAMMLAGSIKKKNTPQSVKDAIKNKAMFTNYSESNENIAESSQEFFWLVGHNNDGDVNYSEYYKDNSVNICVLNNFTGALKVDYYYKKNNVFGVNRKGFNFNKSVDKNVNGFENVSMVKKDSCGKGKKALNIQLGSDNIPLFISATPIFSDTKISLAGAKKFIISSEKYRIPTFLLEAITAGNSITN